MGDKKKKRSPKLPIFIYFLPNIPNKTSTADAITINLLFI